MKQNVTLTFTLDWILFNFKGNVCDEEFVLMCYPIFAAIPMFKLIYQHTTKYFLFDIQLPGCIPYTNSTQVFCTQISRTIL